MTLQMVVVAYENAKYTIDAIESLLSQTVPVSFVVWENGSTPTERTALEKWWSDQLPEHGVLHLSEDNVLWTPAINRAIELYWDGEPFIGFMNNDISLPPHGIERMLELASRPEVGIVAPTGSRLGGPQDYVTHHGAADPETLGPKRVPYVVGACCVLRREVWDEVGPLDEDMPLGADDHDYCIRLKAAGYQIWLEESVYVNHRGHASGESANWKKWGEKSWEAFNKKYDGYYASTDEARKCHWDGIYHEGYDR